MEAIVYLSFKSCSRSFEIGEYLGKSDKKAKLKATRKLTNISAIGSCQLICSATKNMEPLDMTLFQNQP